MVRIRTNDIFITDDDKIIFGDGFDSEIFWDPDVPHPTSSGDLRLTTTISGVDPTEDYHLTTKYYVDSVAISDHGNLTGLLDDDHPQYVPRDGSRGFTGTVSGVYPVEDYHLVTKNYVDYIFSQGGAYFGAGHVYAQDLTESSTNSVTYIEKLNLTVSGLDAGTYRIGYSWEWRHSKSNQFFWARVHLDDTTTIYEFGSSPIVDVNTWRLVTGFDYQILSSGTHYIDIDYRSSSTGSTSYIDNAKIEFWRVE